MNEIAGYVNKGFQRITDVSVAIGLNLPAGASIAIITPETAAVRWRDDGTNPTAAIGYPCPIGSELYYDSSSIRALRFIQQAAGAILSIAYYGLFS